MSILPKRSWCPLKPSAPPVKLPTFATRMVAFFALICWIVLPSCAMVQAQNSEKQLPPHEKNGRGAIGAWCESQQSGDYCRIGNILKDSPAEGAGLQVGDQLLRLQPGKQGTVAEQIIKSAPGTRIALEFQRGGTRLHAAVSVADELDLYSRAAARGDTFAEGMLGEMYAWGYGVAEDIPLAISLLRKAAEAGDAAAQDDLGTIYFKGHGVPRDERTAVSLYRKAAEQGLPQGEHDLAEMYMYVDGVKDPKAAFEWYKKAAEHGDALSAWSLGSFYERGHVVERNERTAAEWYQKAAEQGLPQAQAHLGSMYFDGVGVPKDDALALEWFRKAVGKNQAEAEFGLGMMYAYGRGVPKNDATALKWYRKAAAQDHPAAEYFIGMMYESGTGVTKNLNTAKEWYRKSAAHGYQDAAAKLQQLQ